MDGKIQGHEYQASDLIWNLSEALGWENGSKLFPWAGPTLIMKVPDQGQVVVKRSREKPLSVAHIDKLEVYQENMVPVWMVAKHQGSIAV